MLVITVFFLVAVFIVTVWITFSFTHNIVRPLRKLNRKLNEILAPTEDGHDASNGSGVIREN